MLWVGLGKKKIGSSRTKEEIAALYPSAERQKAWERLKKEKKNALLKIALAAAVLTAGLWIYESQAGILDEDGAIKKNAYGAGSRKAELIAVTQSAQESTQEKITVEIPERQYTQAEAEELFTQMLPELERAVLADNESLEEVHANLDFVEELPGYPFAIRWETDQYGIIGTDGRVNTKETPEIGTPVQIKAEISYGELQKEYVFYARVAPEKQSGVAKQRGQLEDALEEAKENTKYDDYFVLPKAIGESPVVWKEKRNSSIPVLLFFMLAAAVLVCAGKDQEVHKKAEKRNQELETDYAEIVCKLALLTGAGMTLRGAMFKIASGYKARKEQGIYRYAYEEILYSCNEMDTGVSEAQAYINWGKRCRSKRYLKLSMLLVQNLKKGSAGLVRSLQGETELAFAERKAQARRAGEEAGTKLLLPMGLMLMIVMAVIIVPAFCSFG